MARILVIATAGAGGDLRNCAVNLYADLIDVLVGTPFTYVRVRGDGPQVSFEFPNLATGTAYAYLWKDSDNSRSFTIGDFVGWYGNERRAASRRERWGRCDNEFRVRRERAARPFRHQISAFCDNFSFKGFRGLFPNVQQATFEAAKRARERIHRAGGAFVHRTD